MIRHGYDHVSLALVFLLISVLERREGIHLERRVVLRRGHPFLWDLLDLERHAVPLRLGSLIRGGYVHKSLVLSLLLEVQAAGQGQLDVGLPKGAQERIVVAMRLSPLHRTYQFQIWGDDRLGLESN
jgi:hypothetical protein